MRLQDRVAIITGGADGIGRAIALAFANEGAKVAVADLNHELAQQAAHEIGRNAIGLRVDVTIWGEVAEMARQTIERFGTIDVLVNSAGNIRKGWVVSFSEEAWDAVLAVNLKGTFLCAKAVLPTMIARKLGRIINIASIAGKVGEPTASAYASAKWGVIGFTRSLALEVAKDGILVNAICPGPIRTKLSEEGWRDGAETNGIAIEEYMQRVRARSPLGRLGTTDDVAKMAVFVASDDCGFTTGSAFNVDGGIVMG